MNRKLTMSMLVIAIAITSGAKGQCNCQNFSKEGKLIKQCPPTPVAGDKSLQVGISIGEINNQDYFSLTLRFRYTAQKTQGNLLLVLANGKMITLKMLNSGLFYIGDNEVCQASYLLTHTSRAILKTSPVKSIEFTLSDGFHHELQTQMNSHIIISQLNCL